MHAQTKKYPAASDIVRTVECEVFSISIVERYRHRMGVSDGSIIATIIAIHISMNIIPASGHDCPGMRIHIMDIVHPPGISIPPAMERQK